MTNYPYYIIAYFDAGILRKVYDNHKFKSYYECLVTISRMSENKYRKKLLERQIIILEYTTQYQGKILNVIENGLEHTIAEPMKYE